MSTEENKARVQRFYEEVFNRKNTAALDEFIDPHAVDHSAPAGAPGGIEGARQFAGMFLAAFPDVRFTVEDLIAEGDQVVARLTQSGTHHGMFLGLPPTGKRVKVTGIEIFRLAGGKIVEEWWQEDLLGLLRQLGAIPAPA
jgi:steroid delta-isomerase-like uncharacterized protein